MRDGTVGVRATRRLLVVATLLLARAVPAVTIADGPLGRWSVSGYAEAYGVWAVEHDSQRQRPEGILDSRITGELHPKARLFLDLRGMVGGPAEHTAGPGFVDISNTFQHDSPEFEIPEGYLDLFLPSLDVRLGKQKFAWGKLDTFQPTDVLNPRRYTDPFVMEEQDAKIGIPALRASYYPPALGPEWPSETSVTLVWVPVPVAVRFPRPDERWFPSAIRLTEGLELPASTLGALPVPAGTPLAPIDVAIDLRAKNVRPPQQLDEGAVGLRLAGLYRTADWAAYFYDGPETAVALNFSTVARIVSFNPVKPRYRAQAETELRPIFERIRLAGGDVALPLGGFTLRVEGAYGEGRLLPRPSADLVAPANLQRGIARLAGRLGKLPPAGVAAALRSGVPIDLGPLFVARDVIEWGAGVDYRIHGWMPVLQVNQTVVLDNDVDLLVNDVDTRLFLVVRKPFFDERLGTETGVVQEIERGYTSALTRVTYAVTDSWRVRVGFLFIAGTRRSRIGQYHDNDEAFLQIRYSY